MEYLGHVISAEELHQSSKKKGAINETPKPQEVIQPRDYLGNVQYSTKFLFDLASHLAMPTSAAVGGYEATRGS